MHPDPDFDCCIDLTVHVVPSGVTAAEAVRRVRDAIEALPGATWVSVAWCGNAPSHLPWLRLFAPADCRDRADAVWNVLTAKVLAAVHRALTFR